LLTATNTGFPAATQSFGRLADPAQPTPSCTLTTKTMTDAACRASSTCSNAARVMTSRGFLRRSNRCLRCQST
jgi:hypothetical protein